jgi:hypothetical protein
VRKISLLVLICSSLSLAAPAKSTTSTTPTAPASTATAPADTKVETKNEFNFTKQSANKNFMLLDFIGATQGFTNLNLEFKISDQFSATGYLATRLIENDDKTSRLTETKGFLVNRYLLGDVGTSNVIISLGPLSYIDIDREISKGISFGAQIAGQAVINDKVIIRAYALGAQSSAVGRIGLQIGIGF